MRFGASRTKGLVSDRLGDVMDFFGLTEYQAHVAFCSCHLGSSIGENFE